MSGDYLAGLEAVISSWERPAGPFPFILTHDPHDPFERLRMIRRDLDARKPRRRVLNVRKRRTRAQAKRRRIVMAGRKANVMRLRLTRLETTEARGG